MILILPIRKQGVFSHLFMSFLDFFEQCFVILIVEIFYLCGLLYFLVFYSFYGNCEWDCVPDLSPGLVVSGL